MKNRIIAGGIFILLYTTAANAQSESGTGRDEKEMKREARKTAREEKRNEKPVANYQSMQAFARDFPDAENVSWAQSTMYDEATFESKGITLTAYYGYDSELIGTTSTKKITDIPVAAQKQIAKNYKDYTVSDVILFDDNEANDADMELFSKAFNDEDNYFVTLRNTKETIILKVGMDGEASFFKKL